MNVFFFVSNVLNICLLLFAQQGAPKQKIYNDPICVDWFILTVHFILENWLLFWYNCGLHENHLLRNLFFYASAVNVHIVAVWCSMIKKQSGLFWWLSVSVRITVERTGASRNITSTHLIFHGEEATQNFAGSQTRGKPSNQIGKGILRIPWSKMLPHPLIYWLTLGKLLSSPHVRRENPIHTVSLWKKNKKSCSVLFVFLQIFLLKKKNKKIFKSYIFLFLSFYSLHCLLNEHMIGEKNNSPLSGY